MVAQTGNNRPLKLTTTPGDVLSDGLSDLRLELSAYDQPFTAATPGSFVDLADRNTLPVHAVALGDTFAFENCDANGCTLSGQVRNDGGRLGIATATFRVRKGGQDVGSCLVNAPALSYGETATLACRIDYDRRSTSITGTVHVDNPVV
jgi:hypothetical protein